MRPIASGPLTRKGLSPIYPTCPSTKIPPTKTMNDQLTAKLKYLQLDGLLAHWDDYLKLAADQRWSDTRLLTHVIEEEYRIKRGRRRQRRLHSALLPEP